MQSKQRKMTLKGVIRERHSLTFNYDYNGRSFPCTYKYDKSVDFFKLEA